MEEDKKKKIIKSPYYPILKFAEDSILVERGLYGLDILPKIQFLHEKMEEEYFSNNYQACIDLCDEILKSNSLRSEPFYESNVFFRKSECLCRFGKYNEAIIWVEKALQHYPNDFHLFYLKAMCLYEFGNYEEALVWFRKVLNNCPDGIQTTMGTYGEALCLYALNNFKEALVLFDVILQRKPEDQLVGSYKEDCLENKISCLEKLLEKNNEKFMKKYILLTVLVCIIVGVTIWVFYTKPKKEETNITTPEQVQQAKVDLITQQLADKYQANINWDKGIDYTLQLQEKLLNGKPTLFKGNVTDVFTRDNKFFIKLSPSYSFNLDYILELDCDKRIVDEVQSHTYDPLGLFGENYIVIANINSISKPAFSLNGSVLSENEVEIQSNYSDQFIIKGSCLDATFIGEAEGA